ncbi:MAG TPA: hypothetical protein VGH28_27055 [Polyangiaceae bacterium]|jgi:hypothetical protein
MTMYRKNAVDEALVLESPKRRVRPLFIAIGSVAAHAALLAAAFAARAPAPAAPKTATVQVLAGQVDPWTGDFRATGVRTARIRN